MLIMTLLMICKGFTTSEGPARKPVHFQTKTSIGDVKVITQASMDEATKAGYRLMSAEEA